MKNIINWYHPFSTRSRSFTNFWRQVIFIMILFLLSYFISGLSSFAFDATRDFFLRTQGTYERTIAASVSSIFNLVGAAFCLYASWLICWASKQQMKPQGFGIVPEVIMWTLFLSQALVATKTPYTSSYFSTLTLTIPIASIFSLILLINGFLQSHGINLKQKVSVSKGHALKVKENLKNAANSITEKQ